MKLHQMESQGLSISVIIPTYREESNIERCLKSIQNQHFDKKRIETLVVDSDSSDRTRSISKAYANKVINILERGVGKARNIGAAASKNELLLFLDADTILDPNFLREICHSFADPNIVCVSGKLMALEKLGPLGDLYGLLHYGLLNKISMFSAHLGFPLFPTVCCACRKTFFEEVGGFNEQLAIGEDMVFSRKMGKVGKCRLNGKAVAYTSMRRIKKNGRLRNYFIYFRNYFKIVFQKKTPWIRDFPHPSEF